MIKVGFIKCLQPQRIRIGIGICLWLFMSQACKSFPDSLEKMIEKAQQTEDQFFYQENLLNTLQQELQLALGELGRRSSEVKNFVNYLYHIEKYSLFLSWVTLSDIKDLVHLNMMLTSLEPRIKEKFKEVLFVFSQIANLQKQIQEKKALSGEIKNAYETAFKEGEAFLANLPQEKKSGQRFPSLEQLEKAIFKEIEPYNCQPITDIPSTFASIIESCQPVKKDETFSYPLLVNRVIRGPFHGKVVLEAEVEGQKAVLLEKEKTFVFLYGMDYVIQHPGSTVAASHPIGIIFGNSKQLRTLYVRGWACHNKDH